MFHLFLMLTQYKAQELIKVESYCVLLYERKKRQDVKFIRYTEKITITLDMKRPIMGEQTSVSLFYKAWGEMSKWNFFLTNAIWMEWSWFTFSVDGKTDTSYEGHLLLICKSLHFIFKILDWKYENIFHFVKTSFWCV